ncbi:hypothetical protein BGLA2_2290002 [Burkholderia gladioli]|nr:hypothetical protein BGLA2_2290002 [Burkholderia gladioli]
MKQWGSQVGSKKFSWIELAFSSFCRRSMVFNIPGAIRSKDFLKNVAIPIQRPQAITST